MSGFIFPEGDSSSFALDITLSNLKLNLLQPYISIITSRMSGLVSGSLQLRGSASRPQLSGRLMARRASILIDYLNEEYSFTHEIIVTPGGFEAQELELFDSYGQKALFDGGLYHENFRDLRVDFSVKPERFSVLNTTQSQNELFYGKGRATGTARFSGPVDDLLMEIRATTEKGTRIHIPINYDAEVSERGYITFVEAGFKEEEQPANDGSLSGLRMDFELNATPDAEVEINLPSRMGIIQGKGQGNLRFNIDTRGDFNMYGDYEISEGFFDMTLQNLLSRRFELRKGGTIRWNGDPYAADLAITAVYKVRASLVGLIPGGDSSGVYRQRVPVNCVIRLSDDLMSPRIRFAFELPESSEEINRIVFSQIDTTNEALMSRQMISLLVLNSFISEEGTGSLASGVSASSFELLSMQLSNWLSQISQDFDIGVHYRPGDQMTNEELELALTTQV
ncbi:MAG: translocation/assembly module TamB domain-containing protein, partial [Bacteroidales bacterium]|nr:translocation/assembly module TamB domain-containing protein [Bacteroidales bacterium]